MRLSRISHAGGCRWRLDILPLAPRRTNCNTRSSGRNQMTSILKRLAVGRMARRTNAVRRRRRCWLVRARTFFAINAHPAQVRVQYTQSCRLTKCTQAKAGGLISAPFPSWKNNCLSGLAKLWYPVRLQRLSIEKQRQNERISIYLGIGFRRPSGQGSDQISLHFGRHLNPDPALRVRAKRCAPPVWWWGGEITTNAGSIQPSRRNTIKRSATTAGHRFRLQTCRREVSLANNPDIACVNEGKACSWDRARATG